MILIGSSLRGGEASNKLIEALTKLNKHSQNPLC